MQRRSFLQLLTLGGSSLVFPGYCAGNTTGEDESIKDYLYRMSHPDNAYEGDITASSPEKPLLSGLTDRLGRVQSVVGHGHFNVLSFDNMLRFGRRYSAIGAFNKAETDFLEKLFYEDAVRYGFHGEKPLSQLTESIDRKAIVKLPYTGQYLFKGAPLELYRKIRRDVGDTITLTSGVRGVVKQMHLFLRKASRNQGNLSLASRSLAPPGYSFHGTGDFDVGRIGLGARNFSEAFAKTEEFRKLIDLGYIDIRYPLANNLGVRFEPWHIKIT
ncbi:MAG: M15 family metallopeptidase [Candidatus Sedimenticola sp. 20ELBAFRAG]